MTAWIVLPVVVVLLLVSWAALVLRVLKRRRILVAPKYSMGRFVLHQLRCAACGEPLEHDDVVVTNDADGKIAHLACAQEKS